MRVFSQIVHCKPCLASSERTLLSSSSRNCLLDLPCLPKGLRNNEPQTLTQHSHRNHFIAFFSDSNPCTDGTLFGIPQIGFQNCNQPLTILGHQNITFTGCPPYTTTFPGSLPTGVADSGAPALKCKPKANPPNGPYGGYADCPYIPGNDKVNVGSVSLLEYCS